MSSLNLAKETMYNENQKIVIVNDNKVVYKNDGFGIKPLYLAYMKVKGQMKGASCSDRVIGKAAAWIYREADIKELYCEVITTRAKNLLIDNGIRLIFVEDRDKTGMCPVEILAKDEDDFDNLLVNIEKFLVEKGLL